MDDERGRRPEWRVLLLGGTTAAGKSTTARKVARRFGIGCISGDAVWWALLALTTPQTHPVLHRWPRPDEAPGPPEELAALHIEEAQTLAPAMEAFVDKEMQEGNRFVFHAAWITPETAAKAAASPGVRAVFIDETAEDVLMESVLARIGREEPDARQRVMVKVAVLYGEWLREGAKQLRVPLVAGVPRETLVERVLEAANGEPRTENHEPKEAVR